jgi:HPt (histidine-containing phosphotransfer) domain-containing protein
MTGPVDWLQALENTGGDRQLLREVSAAALTEWPLLLDRLGTAIGKSDGETTFRAAHTMKSALGTLGATTAEQLAIRLESLGRNCDWQNAPGAFQQLRDEMDRVTDELSRFLCDQTTGGDLTRGP